MRELPYNIYVLRNFGWVSHKIEDSSLSLTYPNENSGTINTDGLGTSSHYIQLHFCKYHLLYILFNLPILSSISSHALAFLLYTVIMPTTWITSTLDCSAKWTIRSLLISDFSSSESHKRISDQWPVRLSPLHSTLFTFTCHVVHYLDVQLHRRNVYQWPRTAQNLAQGIRKKKVTVSSILCNKTIQREEEA